MIKEIEDYLKEDIYPFHMPGHKRNKNFLNFNYNLYNYDMTEFSIMDNLHDANGIIKNLEENCAKTFGAYKSFILVNGSSCGIIASILATCTESDEILVLRSCHKSVYSGLIYSGVKPKYIYPVVDDKGLVIGLDLKELEEILSKNNNIKSVLITSPTYEGNVLDIKSISEIVHKYNKILIVDEAHGSHFKFHNIFPKTALEQNADIVIQSLHKTLPCFTQTSILHIGSNRVNLELLKLHLSMIQTSSPSYIFMVGVDNTINLLNNKSKELFNDYIKLLNNFRENILNLKNLSLYNNNNLDIGKLLFFINKDISGEKIYNILEKKYKLQFEMYTKNSVLAMTSVADRKEGYYRLYDALNKIDKNLDEFKDRDYKSKFNYPKSKLCLTPREAINKIGKRVDIKDSIGKVALEFITPYPPGVPIVVPGELLTSEVVDFLITNNFAQNIKVE